MFGMLAGFIGGLLLGWTCAKFKKDASKAGWYEFFLVCLCFIGVVHAPLIGIIWCWCAYVMYDKVEIID